jgi:hypothetical protein
MRIEPNYVGYRKPNYIANEIEQWWKKVASIVFTTAKTASSSTRKRCLPSLLLPMTSDTTVWADPWGVGGIFSGEPLSWFLLCHPEVWHMRSAAAGAEWVMYGALPFSLSREGAYLATVPHKVKGVMAKGSPPSRVF